MKNKNIVHVVEEYDIPRYEMAIEDNEFGEGKYEAFVLGAYIHSGTSFSISKTGDHRCRFDSCNLGFIGVPKSMNVDEIAEELTAAWEGEYKGYDNLLDDYENME